MCIPKSLTIAQFTIIMLAMIFVTVMAGIAAIYFIDYQQKAGPIVVLTLTALIFEAFILAFGAIGMDK